jgi:hypothetical protein
MRHFLLACELPAVFTLALVGAFLAATAAPAFLSPSVVLAARPYVVAFFLLAALWCFILWLILLSRPLHLSRPATLDHPSTR